jgi:hypothetical protein
VRSADGIALRDLEPMTRVAVQTANTLYDIVVLTGTTVRIQGGRPFPEPSTTALHGSSDGDGPLKAGWIGVGFRMEVSSCGRRYVTSRVRAIRVHPPAAS